MICKVGLSSVCEKWLQPCFDAKSLHQNKLVDIEQPKSLFLFSIYVLLLHLKHLPAAWQPSLPSLFDVPFSTCYDPSHPPLPPLLPLLLHLLSSFSLSLLLPADPQLFQYQLLRESRTIEIYDDIQMPRNSNTLQSDGYVY